MSEFKETIGELFNLQGNKFFRTVRGLTIAPGETIRAFAAGDRKSFLHPFTYAITTIGILIFLTSFVDFEPTFSKENVNVSKEIIQKYENKNTLNEHQNSSLRFNKFMVSKFEDASTLQNISKYSQYCLFFIISLLHLLVYKNLNFGLKKNIWFIFYVVGHVQILSILVFPLEVYFSSSFSGDDFSMQVLLLIFNIFTFFFYTWAVSHYYEISFMRGLKKNLFTYLFLFLTLIILILIATIFTIIYFF